MVNVAEGDLARWRSELELDIRFGAPNAVGTAKNNVQFLTSDDHQVRAAVPVDIASDQRALAAGRNRRTGRGNQQCPAAVAFRCWRGPSIGRCEQRCYLAVLCESSNARRPVLVHFGI